MGPGTVREYDFREPFPDPAGELHLSGPIAGHARLIRTSEGILAHSDYHARVVLECSRCLDETIARVNGTLDEEFLPITDVRTGLSVPLPDGTQDDQPLINEHHEIDLNEILRQNILTSLPLQPLCEMNCPGLCPECGERLDNAHVAHPQVDIEDEAEPVDPANPFARLAVLLHDDEESD
ncbi:MAG: DUF177 domain-containing protein [Chloroflexi bacterium]|nr:DUF177 domain-containing protein [Chloroflexota bacterium]